MDWVSAVAGTCVGVGLLVWAYLWVAYRIKW